MATYFVETTVEMSLFTKRGHRAVARLVNKQLAIRHRDRIVPKHFAGTPETTPGSGGYRYRRRSKKWQERKRLEGRPSQPLVYTGELFRTVRASSRVRSTDTFWQWTARGSFPLNADRKSEIEAVSEREQRENARLFERLYARAATRDQFQTHIRRRRRG